MFNPSTIFLSIASLAGLVAFYLSGSFSLQTTQGHLLDVFLGNALATPEAAKDPVSLSTRVHWMRQANAVLAQLSSSPCPFGAFGTVIVNHTGTSGFGELVCIGLNARNTKGNPTLHGEIAAINNCSSLLTDPVGRYKLSTNEALDAYLDLSLYTNGEPCPMCASAIRWAGFKECIYGTSIKTLIARGWGQITISSQEVFKHASHLPGEARLIKEILTNETDPYFSWQFDQSYPCPAGCSRGAGGSCVA